MSISKEEALAELKRRGVDIEGAATATDQNPAGALSPAGRSKAAVEDSLIAQTRQEQPGGLELARAALRGGTFGLSDSLGAGIASIPASFGSDQSIGDVYRDIRGTLQAQEDEARELNPELMGLMEGAGTTATIAAAALPAATRAALAKGASRVAGGANRAAGGLRGARAAAKGGAKPRYVKQGGEWVEVVPQAAGKGLLRGSTRGGAAVGGGLGLAGDIEDALEGEEIIPDELAAGIVGGATLGYGAKRVGRALGNLAMNSPVGRMASSSAGGRVLGDKYRKWIYALLHPHSRHRAEDVVNAVRGK